MRQREPPAPALRLLGMSVVRQPRTRLALLALGVLLGGCSSQAPDQLAQPDDGVWTPLAPSPLSPRHGSLAATVDGKALVLGGDTAPLCPPNASCTFSSQYASDGAHYDPATGRWQATRPAPVPLAQHASAAVLGSSVYVLQTSGDGNSSVLLEYDATRDSWSRPPLPPEPAYRRLLVAGGRLLVSSGTLADPVVGLALDSSAGSWEPLPPAPFPPAQYRQLGAIGDRLLLLSADAGPPLEQQAAYLRAAVLDVSTGWTALPDSEQVVYGNYSEIQWTGEQAVLADPFPADAGGKGSPGNGLPAGGFLDVESGRWSLLPERPAEPTGFPVQASTPRLVGGFGLLLDTEQRRWTSIADTDLAARYQSAQTWVGDTLFVWGGGSTSGGDPVATGATWSPKR